MSKVEAPDSKFTADESHSPDDQEDELEDISEDVDTSKDDCSVKSDFSDDQDDNLKIIPKDTDTSKDECSDESHFGGEDDKPAAKDNAPTAQPRADTFSLDLSSWMSERGISEAAYMELADILARYTDVTLPLRD